MKSQPKKVNRPNQKVSQETVNRLGDRYLDLVREHPLRILRSEADYNHAMAMLERLSDRGVARTSDETEYLLALAIFVERFERQHNPDRTAKGVQMLRYLIEVRKSTQRDVAAGTGLAVSTISKILSGKRRLSVKHIELLARFFNVEPASLLET